MIPWPMLFPIVVAAVLLFCGAKAMWEMTIGDFVERMNAMRESYYGSVWGGNGVKDKVINLSNDVSDLYKADNWLDKRLKVLEEYMNATGGNVTG